MKKILLALTALTYTTLSADFIRIDGGAGAWIQESTGSFKEKSSVSKPIDIVDTLGYESNTNYYAWVYFKHFIPLIPNARLEVAKSEFSGSAKNEFSWNGVEYNKGVSNALSITQYDAILYYNLFDNLLWTTIDLGIDAKYFDTLTSVESSSLTKTDFVIALLYARARIEVPATGLGLEVDIKAMSYSGADIYDMRAKIDYTFDIPILQPGIEIGYRHESIVINSNEIVPVDTKTDLTISGLYAGITLTF